MTKPQPGISAGLPRAQEDPLYNLEKIGDVLDPFSHQPVIVQYAGSLDVIGWAVDGPAKKADGGVDVVIDESPYAAQINIDRGDVATHFKVPDYARAGFSFSAPAAAFGKGDHTLHIRVLSQDRKSYYQGLGLKIHIQ